MFSQKCKEKSLLRTFQKSRHISHAALHLRAWLRKQCYYIKMCRLPCFSGNIAEISSILSANSAVVEIIQKAKNNFEEEEADFQWESARKKDSSCKKLMSSDTWWHLFLGRVHSSKCHPTSSCVLIFFERRESLGTQRLFYGFFMSHAVLSHNWNKIQKYEQ